MNADYEKLGAFYLGRTFDPAQGRVADDLLLYDAKDLTTHAVMLGMTGSGKTGLAVALIEEAAIDGIPAIVIDPKGDLGNLLLQFPDLAPASFRPWLDEAEAARKGLAPDALAGQTAAAWRDGLAQWGQDAARIQRLKDAADFAVYTPGNASVRPLNVLRSFAAPPEAVVQDTSALRDRILSAVSGLLGLLGVEADPVQSREHILLSSILDHAWRAGRDLDLAAVIRDVQSPPFATVGVFDLETFYPAKDRLALAMRVNNVLAAPGFAAWTAGEPLDVQRLLHTPAGRPRVSVLCLAHLPDAERMFFVTALLNEVLAWMRAQPGTGSLRALLYMDEIFGYFPPIANPPSKLPMLTLLKQARAFGLGVVLSTQNPVDLDYKGLSNCGTWFIGRLQTERDKARVLEGLESAAAGAGAGFDRAEAERLVASLGNRVFLMRNVHEDAPVLFQTRWALSFLRGPLTLPQLKVLAGSAGVPPAPVPATIDSRSTTYDSPETPNVQRSTPNAQQSIPGVPVWHLRGAAAAYKPALAAEAKLHFVDAKAAIDLWVTRAYLVPFAGDGRPVYDEAEARPAADFVRAAPPGGNAAFDALPAFALNPKNVAAAARELEDALYRTATLDLFAFPELKLTSAPGESEGDFRARAAHALREKRDEAVAKLKDRYAPKLQTLTDRLRRAQERVEREKAQAGQQKLNTLFTAGAALLGAFLGGGRSRIGTIGRATTAVKSAARIGKESADVARADESAEAVQQRLADLQAEFEREAAALSAVVSPDALALVARTVRPRKSDLAVAAPALCWLPS